MALLLWAVISHLEGRYTRALALGFLVSLSRPEAWAFFFPYAAFTCLTGRSRRAVAIGLAIALAAPVGAAGLVGLGRPLPRGPCRGRQPRRRGGASGPGGVARRARAGRAPGRAARARGLALAARRRDPTVAILGLAAAAWVALLALATEAGYPGAGRFLVLPLALVCVLAGVGAVWLVELGRRRGPARRRGSAAGRRRAAAHRGASGRSCRPGRPRGRRGAASRTSWGSPSSARQADSRCSATDRPWCPPTCGGTRVRWRGSSTSRSSAWPGSASAASRPSAA